MADAAHGHVLVDAHVHFHPMFERATFFDAAIDNMRRGATALRLEGPIWACLMLTESAVASFFDQMRVSNESVNGRWAVRLTDEAESLVAERDADRLLIVAGRQMKTRERLEVLALATTQPMPDGASLDESIKAARAVGAIPVIPWGFGKWWGKRGGRVARVIREATPGSLYLGDNGGRLKWSRWPSLFAAATARGLGVLPGSDPLPFASQNRAAGSYGLSLEGSLDLDRPAAGIRQLIAKGATRAPTFGTREGLVGFVRHQVGMQLRGRR